MLRRVSRLLSLSGADRWLLVQAFATLAAVRLALRLTTIDRLRAWCGRAGRPHRTVDSIVWAASLAARWSPGANCLSLAFTVQRLLSRHGHACDVHIGVAREGERLAAHAWVVRDGTVLVDTEDHGAYTRLVAWPADRRAGDGLGPA